MKWGVSAEHGLKAAVTVASSLEYGMSDSSLKLLIPFVSVSYFAHHILQRNLSMVLGPAICC